MSSLRKWSAAFLTACVVVTAGVPADAGLDLFPLKPRSVVRDEFEFHFKVPQNLSELEEHALLHYSQDSQTLNETLRSPAGILTGQLKDTGEGLNSIFRRTPPLESGPAFAFRALPPEFVLGHQLNDVIRGSDAFTSFGTFELAESYGYKTMYLIRVDKHSPPSFGFGHYSSARETEGLLAPWTDLIVADKLRTIKGRQVLPVIARHSALEDRRARRASRGGFVRFGPAANESEVFAPGGVKIGDYSPRDGFRAHLTSAQRLARLAAGGTVVIEVTRIGCGAVHILSAPRPTSFYLPEELELADIIGDEAAALGIKPVPCLDPERCGAAAHRLLTERQHGLFLIEAERESIAASQVAEQAAREKEARRRQGYVPLEAPWPVGNGKWGTFVNPFTGYRWR